MEISVAEFKKLKRQSEQMPAAKAALIRWLQLTYGDRLVAEHRFHAERKWRLDWALPDIKLGIEYQGMFGGKAHRATGNVLRDAEKLNECQTLGWILLQVNATSIDSGAAFRQIEAAHQLQEARAHAIR